MRTILFLIFISLIYGQKSFAQGCVAIRSTGAVCTMQDAGKEIIKGWQLNTGYRYFKSFRHFIGTKEQKARVKDQTDVRNWQNTIDLSLVRHISRRWSLAIDLPILANKRSSLYEHGGKERHSTHSFGLGDMRITAYRWLLDPAISIKRNVQVGLGIKLPTGDDNYQDFFYKADGTRVIGPVDQSIQLGDGGTGFTTEMNAYYNFSGIISVYGNFYYLFNPRDQNGISTARGATPSSTSLTYKSSTMSVPDQYMARAGANIVIHDLTLSAGIRMECLPVHDLVGSSYGFRRPGYVISAEPAISYRLKKITAYAGVPVAMVRSRTQSVPDKIRTTITGIYAQGDAAFADYSINIGLAFRF